MEAMNNLARKPSKLDATQATRLVHTDTIPPFGGDGGTVEGTERGLVAERFRKRFARERIRAEKRVDAACVDLWRERGGIPDGYCARRHWLLQPWQQRVEK